MNRNEFVTHVLDSLTFSPKVNNFFLNPNPEDPATKKQLTNALLSFGQNVDPKEIILFIDTSLLKNGKKGIIFTPHKIYSYGFPPLDYADIQKAKGSFGNLYIDKRAYLLNNGGATFSDVKAVANALQFIAEQLQAETNTAVSPSPFTTDAPQTAQRADDTDPADSEVTQLDPFQGGRKDAMLYAKRQEAIEAFKQSNDKQGNFLTNLMLPSSVLKGLFILIAPFYLYMVYWAKTEPGLEMMFFVLLFSLLIYLPIQVIVHEKQLPLTLEAIFNDSDVRKIFVPLVVLIACFIIYYFFGDHFTGKTDKQLFSLAVFLVWWLLTENILNLMARISTFQRLKFIVAYVLLAILVIFMSFESQNIDFSLTSVADVLKIILFPIVAVPRFFFRLVKTVISVLLSFTGMKIDIGKVLNASFYVFFVLLMLIPVTMDIAVKISRQIDPESAALLWNLAILATSATGIYFNFRILATTFLKNDMKAIRVSQVSSALFLTLIVGLTWNSGMNKKSSEIKNAQKALENTYKNYKSR